VRSSIDQWFRRQGFSIAKFENGKLRVSTHSEDHTLVFKLTEQSGCTSYYKEATGGALIVFEVAIGNDGISFEGYCPLLLFGIWEKKLDFKKDAGALSKYRAEGYAIEQQFLDHLKGL
jgi:hypothetical protein